MSAMRETGLDNTIKDLIQLGLPFLGICLGCQIMLDYSEENDTKTLGLFPGQNLRFDKNRVDESGLPIRIPHMGWNNLRITSETALLEGLGDGNQFYFVHSYYPNPDLKYIIAKTTHGGEFCSVFGKEGTWAVQFHPEKSGKPGLRLLQNFYGYSLNH
jgi:glutamine amidotransferase